MWGIAPLSRENSWSFRSARNARIAHRNPLVMALDGPMKRNSSLVRRQQEEEDDSALRARLKAPTTEDEPSTLPPQYPQTGENESSTSRPGKFKAVSQLVLAMNRFKASLNPTITFGKRTDSGNSLGGMREIQDSDSQGDDSLISSPNENPECVKVYNNRGHKTNYLLRPLPPAASESQVIS